MLKNSKLAKIVPVTIAVVMLISILTYAGYSSFIKYSESRKAVETQISALQDNSSAIGSDAKAGDSQNQDNTTGGQLKGSDTNSGASQNLDKPARGQRH